MTHSIKSAKCGPQKRQILNLDRKRWGKTRHCSSPNESHEVGDGRVEEVLQVGRQDGDVDVGPGEGVEQGADGLAHKHQLLEVGGVDEDLVLEEGAHEELDGVLDAQQVQEVEQVEVEEGQLRRRPGQRDRAGVAQTPESAGVQFSTHFGDVPGPEFVPE